MAQNKEEIRRIKLHLIELTKMELKRRVDTVSVSTRVYRQSTHSPTTVHYEEDFNREGTRAQKHHGHMVHFEEDFNREGTRALKSAMTALRNNPDTSDVRGALQSSREKYHEKCHELNTIVMIILL